MNKCVEFFLGGSSWGWIYKLYGLVYLLLCYGLSSGVCLFEFFCYTYSFCLMRRFTSLMCAIFLDQSFNEDFLSLIIGAVIGERLLYLYINKSDPLITIALGGMIVAMISSMVAGYDRVFVTAYLLGFILCILHEKREKIYPALKNRLLGNPL